MGNHFLKPCAVSLRSCITCIISVISGFNVVRVVSLHIFIKEKALVWKDKDIHNWKKMKMMIKSLLTTRIPAEGKQAPGWSH